MNKKHLIVFVNPLGIQSTTSKNWARANRRFFPAYGFTTLKGDTPTSEEIDEKLRAQGFERRENSKMIIHFNFN